MGRRVCFCRSHIEKYYGRTKKLSTILGWSGERQGFIAEFPLGFRKSDGLQYNVADVCGHHAGASLRPSLHP